MINWLPAANHRARNGHPLFLWPDQGASRVDYQAGEYLVLYAGNSPVGAVAEAFGRFPRWTAAILSCPKSAPVGSVKALAHYRGRPAVLDLDSPDELAARGLRPSRIVTRQRTVTQSWARSIYDEQAFGGVSWWSYYDPDWTSFGLWDTSDIRVQGTPELLDLDHPALLEAAASISRIVSSK